MLKAQIRFALAFNLLNAKFPSLIRMFGRSRATTNIRFITTESFLSPNDIPPVHKNLVDIEDTGSLRQAKISTALLNQSSAGVTVRSPEVTNLKFGPNLLRYGVNLNKLAEEGKLDEVVGRDKEILIAMQVLSRRRKNNPCLVGEAGVGASRLTARLEKISSINSSITHVQARLRLQRALRCSFTAGWPPRRCWTKWS